MSGPKSADYYLEQQRREELRRQQEEERKRAAQEHIYRQNRQKLLEIFATIDIKLTEFDFLEQKFKKRGYEGDFLNLEGFRLKVKELKGRIPAEISLAGRNSSELLSTNIELNKFLEELESVCSDVCNEFEYKYDCYKKKLEEEMEKAGYLTYDPDMKRKVKEACEFDKAFAEFNKLMSSFIPEGYPTNCPYPDQFENLKKIVNNFKESKDLFKFIDREVKPFIYSAKKYKEKINEFNELMVEYQSLVSLYGTEPLDFENYKIGYFELLDGITKLQFEIDDLRTKELEEREYEYIYQALSEAMNELGYSLYGDMNVKKSKQAKIIYHQLYLLSGDTVVDVFFEDDGQISMQVGKLDDVDREPTEDEKVSLVADMTSFCGDYKKLEEILRKKGVNTGDISACNPGEEYAQIINCNDFGVKVEKRTKKIQKKENIHKQSKTDVHTRKKEKQKLKHMQMGGQ